MEFIRKSDYSQLQMFQNRASIKKVNGIHFRVLPSVKIVHSDQPINYIAYQKSKRNKKVQNKEAPKEQNLFLEGEYFFANKSNLRRKQTHSQIVEPISINSEPNTNDFNRLINQKKVILRPYPALSREEMKSETIQPKKKENNTVLQRKTHRIYNTLQPNFKPTYSLKPKARQNSNQSLVTINTVEQDRSKPLFYLDKKDLSKIKAQSFVVLQHGSLQVLTGNRYKNQAQIASLTKIMTFYTVYRLARQFNIDITNQKATVCDLASDMSGTTAQLVVGDILTVQELLYGLMLPSGNDAAVALAQWGGSLLPKTNQQPALNAFVKYMNKYAKEIDLKQSTFGNPHGLPDFRNASTPYDLAILISNCMNIPLFCKVVNTKLYKLWVQNEGGKKELIWENTNKLLRRNGFIGVKTGVTVTAGPCLASCYQSGDQRFIVVLLRTNKLSRRFKETRYILGWSLCQYNKQKFGQEAKKILKNDAVLDSDNSEDEQEFNYNCLDAAQLIKRQKILQNQL